MKFPKRFFAPTDGEGSDLGGDRGDDFESTDEDPAVMKAAADKAEAEKAAKQAKDEGEEKEAKAKAEAEAKAKKPDAKDDEDEDKKVDKRKDDRIPASRHKEILEKERARADELEKKLARYEGGQKVADINEDIKKVEDQVSKLDEEYSSLITDGKHKEAAEKMAQIRRLEREIAEERTNLKAAAATAQAVEKIRYDTTVDRLEAAYPILNPDHEDHDADKAQDVVDLAASYRLRRGMTPAEAIQKAAKTLLGAENKRQESAVETKARVDKEEAEKLAAKAGKDAAKEAEDKRKRDQVAKNIEADKKQPPSTAKIGADTDKAGGGIDAKSVMKMSHDEFVKLDEDTLAKMRGDELV